MRIASGTKSEPVSKELSIEVDANESGSPRSGRLTISAKGGSLKREITVEQSNEFHPTEGEEIELGLSRKWARVNIGATNPEDRGDLFPWGETATLKPGQKYSGDRYSHTMNAFYRPSGTYDKRSRLSDDDDAATQILGNKWRMPTDEEIEELLYQAAQTYPFEYKDNQGLLLRGANGNSIFIPACGYELGYAAPADNVGDVVCFWSNTVATSDNDQAYVLMSHIANSSLGGLPGLPFIQGTTLMFYRFGGLPVRAVRRADIKIGELKAETTPNSATLSATIELDGIELSRIQKAGFLYSSTGYFNNPNQIDTLICTPTSAGLRYQMEALSSGTIYKVRPFLIVEKEGNYTAPVQEFSTK